MNAFKEAAKRKLRFDTPKGSLSVEQLFDLSKGDITKTGAKIEAELEELSDGKGFFSGMQKKSSSMKVVRLKMDILEEVYLEHEAAEEEAEARAARKEKLFKIENALEKAENRSLESLTPEELRKMKAELVSS